LSTSGDGPDDCHPPNQGAFCGLLEMEHGILLELMAAFRSESDNRVREFLVEIIWQHRQPSAIPFLGEALHDREAAVWKQALDGLVTLASPAALEVLCAARTRQFPVQRETKEFRRWLDEAIEQAESEAHGGECHDEPVV
jgi:hypothetical protein